MFTVILNFQENNPYTQQQDNIDSLIKYTAPHQRDTVRRTNSMTTVRETYLPFDTTFKDLFPLKALHVSHLACQRDPVMQYGLQAQEIRQDYKRGKKGFIIEPRHEKTCLWGFPTRLDSNRSAQLQKLDSLETSGIATLGFILCRQQTTKALIRLRGCTGWSAHLLFAYGIRQVFFMTWLVNGVLQITLVNYRPLYKVRDIFIPEHASFFSESGKFPEPVCSKPVCSKSAFWNIKHTQNTWMSPFSFRVWEGKQHP